VRDARSDPWSRQALRSLKAIALLVLVSLVSIAFALRVTPPQRITTLGQTVELGAALPTLSASGPGEIVLFGRSLPTGVEFVGPIRPRLVLTDISVTRQIEDLFRPGTSGAVANTLGAELAAGWRRYFVRESVFVALGAVLILGAIAGWRRSGARRTLAIVAGGLMVVELVNLGAVAVTALSAPGVLQDVSSLNELVGRDEPRPLPPAPGADLNDVQAVVIGDSTAAGLGGPPLRDPSPEDIACERSSWSFATTLGRVNGWEVRNLACSGATVEVGVLGEQAAGGRVLAPQLAVAKRSSDLRAVIVNIGANDMRWSELVQACAASATCDNRALTAFFQQSLDSFAQDYLELLRQLTTVPGEPVIVITQYYAPFDPGQTCAEGVGITAEKIDTLNEHLRTINEVLASGAGIFGFRTARPDLSGHGICSERAYVQGFDDPAPFHPNDRGQLVIALAVERALLETP
jgi:lysophospholipase L1-like esterase